MALVAAAAAEMRAQAALGAGGEVRNALVSESEKLASTGKSVSIMLASDGVNFNTSADGADIYQRRSGSPQTGGAAKRTSRWHSPLPPLPARRSESAQDLKTQADLFRNQADVLSKQGRYTEAEEFYLREFTVAEKLISAGEISYYYSIASGLRDIYQQQHRTTDLEALHKRLLAAVQKAPGPEEKALSFITDIADFYFWQERYLDAEPYYKQALALGEKSPGREQYYLLRVLEHLTKLYMLTRRDAEVEPLLKRELAITEEIHKPESNEVVGPLLRLATYYANQDRANEAIPLFERLFAAVQREIKEKGNSYRLDQTFGQMGELYQRLGRFAEAEALYKRLHAFGEEALLTQKNTLVYNHAVGQLRKFYRDRDRPGELEALLQGSLELHEKIFGYASPDLFVPLNLLAAFRRRQGRHEEAEELYRRALAIPGVDPQDILPPLAAALRAQGRHGEAEELFKRVLAARESEIGPRDFLVSSYSAALHDLVKLYQGLGRAAEVEQLYERSAALLEEKVLKPANQKKGELLHSVAFLYHEHGRYADAARVAERWLAQVEVEGNEEAILKALEALGAQYLQQERLADAEPIVMRAVSLAEKLHGPAHVKTAMAVQDLARVYRRQMRYREAEALFLRAVGIVETRLASLNRSNSIFEPAEIADASKLSNILNNLGLLYGDIGEYSKAEQTLRKSIEVVNSPEFASHYSSFAAVLSNLGTLYLELGRLSEAEPLLRQALQVNERASGPTHPDTALGLHNLGLLRLKQRRHAQGEDLLRRALAISETASGPEYITVASPLNILGQALADQGRHDEAEPLLKRALAISEKAFGPDHPDVAVKLKGVADLYIRQNRNAEAGAAMQRVLAIMKKTLGNAHDRTAISLGALASVYERHGDWPKALQLRREAISILASRPHRHEVRVDAGLGAQEAAPLLYLDYAHTAMQLAQRDSSQRQALTAEAFEIVQRARHSEAATALAQTAARLAADQSELARLARRRQDLAERFSMVDKALATLDVEKLNSDAKRHQRNELRKEREGIEKQIAEIDALLREHFPDYAALVNPKPLSVSEVQHQLRPGEAVYQVVVAKNRLFGWSEVYAWVVTPEAMRGAILPMDEQGLADAVDALRCGLDFSVWNKSRGAEAEGEDERGLDGVEADNRGRPGPERCQRLLGPRPVGQVLPFDLARAHELYKSLFTPFEDLIRDKHLLVVPTGSLGTLPFQVLVTRAPSADTEFADAAWLGLRQPITVLPSVPSLKALRTASRQRAAHPYVGFGNPLLTGSSGDNRSAWEKQSCAQSRPLWTRVAGGLLDRGPSEDGAPPSILRGVLQDFYRNGLGNVATIRMQPPLPETADELCSVAKALGAPDRAVFLGARASEARLKDLSGKGELGAARVVHFATHGLVGAETEVLARSRLEPALLMTPPDEPSEIDDGLLTSSEIAQLKLNADFVILSACNTAAGDGKADGEALSGLARAFLYAGSRSLLVSHWYVDSRAAVDLVTGMFGELEANPALSRAEALRRAMAAQVSQGRFRAHPSYWAPFVIVGEGGGGA
jgi:CHAT domain-containing protein/tetratricopeptide (TPR) repeat protein